MKYKAGIVSSMVLCLFMTFTSCVKENDITQNETSQPSSVITSNLVVANLKASSFIDDSTQLERTVRMDTTRLDLMSSDFFKEEMTKSSLSFHFKNSLNNDFKIDFEFLNDRNEVKFALQIPIAAGTKEKPIRVETSVIIETPELETFKEATKVVYRITRLPSNAPLTPESEGVLELQSDATYFFDI